MPKIYGVRHFMKPSQFFFSKNFQKIFLVQKFPENCSYSKISITFFLPKTFQKIFLIQKLPQNFSYPKISIKFFLPKNFHKIFLIQNIQKIFLLQKFPEYFISRSISPKTAMQMCSLCPSKNYGGYRYISTESLVQGL